MTNPIADCVNFSDVAEYTFLTTTTSTASQPLFTCMWNGHSLYSEKIVCVHMKSGLIKAQTQSPNLLITNSKVSPCVVHTSCGLLNARCAAYLQTIAQSIANPVSNPKSVRHQFQCHATCPSSHWELIKLRKIIVNDHFKNFSKLISTTQINYLFL